MKTKLILVLTFICFIAKSQNSQTINSELFKLLKLKIQFEKLDEIPEKTTEIISKRNQALNEYKDYVKTIKSDQDKYLQYVNRVISGEVKLESGAKDFFYNYVNTALPFDYSYNSVTTVEYYKIVKEYLFVKNESQLPRTRNDVTFFSKRSEKLPGIPNGVDVNIRNKRETN